MRPLPPQRERLADLARPTTPSENIERIAEAAAAGRGPPKEPPELADGVKAIHAANEGARARSEGFPGAHHAAPVKREDGSTDWDASFARAPENSPRRGDVIAVIACPVLPLAEQGPGAIERLLALKFAVKATGSSPVPDRGTSRPPGP